MSMRSTTHSTLSTTRKSAAFAGDSMGLSDAVGLRLRVAVREALREKHERILKGEGLRPGPLFWLQEATETFEVHERPARR